MQSCVRNEDAHVCRYILVDLVRINETRIYNCSCNRLANINSEFKLFNKKKLF